MRAETKFDDGNGPSNIASANLQHPPLILPPNETGRRPVPRHDRRRPHPVIRYHPLGRPLLHGGTGCWTGVGPEGLEVQTAHPQDQHLVGRHVACRVHVEQWMDGGLGRDKGHDAPPAATAAAAPPSPLPPSPAGRPTGGHDDGGRRSVNRVRRWGNPVVVGRFMEQQDGVVVRGGHQRIAGVDR
jgi:hypothetical protein